MRNIYVKHMCFSELYNNENIYIIHIILQLKSVCSKLAYREFLGLIEWIERDLSYEAFFVIFGVFFKNYFVVVVGSKI